MKQNRLLIKIKMKKNSFNNIHNTDIYFNLVLDQFFPENPPTVKCLTNVNFLFYSLDQTFKFS